MVNLFGAHMEWKLGLKSIPDRILYGQLRKATNDVTKSNVQSPVSCSCRSSRSQFHQRSLSSFFVSWFMLILMDTAYSRGGQSAALQRFSAAPVSNFGCTFKLFMAHWCINYPKFTSKTKKILRPAIQYFNEIWPVRKKVWPPLAYSI